MTIKTDNGTAKAFPWKRLVIIAAAVIFALIILFNSFTVVDAGHTGVVVTMGSVNEGVLTEGIHPKVPFAQSVVKIDNRIKSWRSTPKPFQRTCKASKPFWRSTIASIPQRATAFIKTSEPITKTFL